jgi:hypothetical protein
VSYAPLKVIFISKNVLLTRSSANAIEAATLLGVQHIQDKRLSRVWVYVLAYIFLPLPLFLG